MTDSRGVSADAAPCPVLPQSQRTFLYKPKTAPDRPPIVLLTVKIMRNLRPDGILARHR
jgi:hypothetical protein